MKTIYLDSDYMYYLENGEGRTVIETDEFNNTVDAAIPYYRYIPQGEEQAAPKKGRVYYGIFIQAIDNEKIVRITQQAYITDMQNALALLGVEA